ncbi:hypothetical protein [Streptomyces sp. NPDC021608]|uniref:hypothetical protein n=1 Tax=Streptomyces sp. NPDC021608 TaxID=3154903 RepID=UPI0033DF0DDC
MRETAPADRRAARLLLTGGPGPGCVTGGNGGHALLARLDAAHREALEPARAARGRRASSSAGTV